jgi:hypothetical protein
MRERKTDFQPVRIHTATRKRLDRLIEQLVQVGWNAIGAERKDAPGISSVLDEGITALESKMVHTQTKSARR